MNLRAEQLYAKAAESRRGVGQPVGQQRITGGEKAIVFLIEQRQRKKCGDSQQV